MLSQCVAQVSAKNFGKFDVQNNNGAYATSEMRSMYITKTLHQKEKSPAIPRTSTVLQLR